ncbi:GNAT family N-acetyltransferase [Glaciecola siphonariae]|uniref:GNAT family N-acetyltransferase n=1 Tax=Glaciecola siphonariae TaxID=521012 RepID=A0ABV9LVA8_9ALTE
MNSAQPLSVHVHQDVSETFLSDMFSVVQSCPLQSPFLSRQWFLSLHAHASNTNSKAAFTFVQFCEHGSTIGFCLVGVQRRWYGDIYYLNQTGIDEFDQMWIEHNDIIATNPDNVLICRAALINTLAAIPRFHRFVVSMGASKHWHTNTISEWSCTEERVAYVDLNAIARNKQDYMDTLSKNSKSSLRRSKNFITKQFGEVTYAIHREKLSSLLSRELAPLHIKQWSDTEHQSGFTNPVFTQFHSRLSESGDERLHFEIMRFDAGDKTLGYLYQFVCDKRVYFYLSAINYDEPNNNYKPGILMHALAIQHYLASGYERYDFLAGAARYKESLSNAHYHMYSLHLVSRRAFHQGLFWANKIIKRVMFYAAKAKR